MTDDWRNFEDNVLTPLLLSAVRTFVKNGYHGSTTRNLAAEAGISVPGLYHHHPSKQAILVAITKISMADLRRRTEAALAEAGEDAQTQLALYVECMVLFHARYKELAFIAASEIRSLSPVSRDAHIAARDHQEQLLRDIITRGTDSQTFNVRDVRTTTLALVTMCTGVSQWFDAEGSMTSEQIADEYVQLAMRAVGIADIAPK